MTYKQLEYFLAIAEPGNMTLAAQTLNISQPPLSYQLKLLEEELQVKLFNRDGHTLHITNEGRIFQDKAMQILSLTNQSVAFMRYISKKVFGTINIATVPSVCGLILPQSIHKFQLKYPDVKYKIHECNSLRAMELLDNGLVDLAFIRDTFKQECYQIKMVKTPFLKGTKKDFFVAIGSKTFLPNTKQDTIDLEKLIGKPLIIYRRYRRYNKILDNICAEKNISLKIICETDYICSAFYMAEADIGIAVMPYTSAMLYNNKKSLFIKKIDHSEIDSQIYLITKKGTTLSPLSQKYIEQIVSESSTIIL